MMRATASRLQPLLRQTAPVIVATRAPTLVCPARRFATIPSDAERVAAFSDRDADSGSNRLSKAPTQGIPPSPFDRPPVGESGLTAEMPSMEGVKDTLGKLSDKAKKIGKKTKQNIVTLAQTPVPEPADHGSRSLHTRAYASAPRDGDSMVEDLKDDAIRLKQKLSNKLKKLGLATESAGVELQDKGQEAWRQTKKSVRRAKDSMSEPMGMGSRPMASSEHQPERELFDVDDAASESEPVRAVNESEVLSTSAGRDNIGNFSVWEPKDGAADGVPPGSAESIGLGQESVKKSFLDGPQEMPQGVGKRATDAEGRPLETGTERS